MKKVFLFLFFSLTCFVSGSSQIKIDFDYPSINGDFYVSGNVFFPPSSVYDTSNIAVIDEKTKKEVPSKITVLEKWFDDSILSAEIIFSANQQRKTEYSILYGKDVKRKRSFSESAVLPTVSFITPGTGKTTENLDISVGQLNVRVDRSPSIRYWWYLGPMFVLIFLTLIRTRRTIKTQR